MPTKELNQNVSITRKITLIAPDNYYTCQFTVEAGYQCIIGRSDEQSAFYPMVDLTDLGGYRMGVSRTHAILEIIDEQVYISDHSSNGTQINGAPIPKGEKKPLENHSTLSFGDLHFHVVIQA